MGAISSFGYDLEVLANSNLRVTYFNEVIGSKLNEIEKQFKNLNHRFKESMKYKNELFTPAIAIHSPYSVHPALQHKVLDIVKNNNLLLSAHFLESKDEVRWLKNNKGSFKNFFLNLFMQNKSLNTVDEFLSSVASINNTILVHNTFLHKKEFKFLKKNQIRVIHCPVSNRLLSNKKADFKYLDNLNSSIGTDGLSSNISLSLFDELRFALFVHNNIDINVLAQKLLLFATKNGALTLRLNSGEIKENKNADLITFNLPDTTTKKYLASNIILHTKKINKSFINGKIVYEQKDS